MHAFTERGRKVDLGIDADTLEIRAIEVAGSRVGDAPMLPELINQIPADQPIGKVSADGAYDTRACHVAIAAREASAVIPARKTLGHGWRQRRVPMPETKSSARPAVSAARTGGAEAGIIGEAWSKQKCAASSCLARASWHATSTGRYPICKSGPRSRTALRPSERRTLNAWDETAQQNGTLDLKLICATEPMICETTPVPGFRRIC